jgi:hypothetical protein
MSGCRFSWDDDSRNPSVAVAVSAITRVICAGSAHVAVGHASCKRQASGSNPLTGSSVTTEMSGDFQVIALDHADFDDTWFADSVVERWKL